MRHWFYLDLLVISISWRSKGQKYIPFFSSKLEYIALYEAAKEAKYVFQLLWNMSVKVKLITSIQVENIGAILMSENVSVSQCTEHVDVIYGFSKVFIRKLHQYCYCENY